jgi:hypothetical protein
MRIVLLLVPPLAPVVPPLLAARQDAGTAEPAGQAATHAQLQAPHPGRLLGLPVGLEPPLPLPSPGRLDTLGLRVGLRVGDAVPDTEALGVGDTGGLALGEEDGSAITPSTFKSNRRSLEDDRKLCTSTATTLVPATRPLAPMVMMDGVVSSEPSTAVDARVEWPMRPVGMLDRATSAPFK